MSKLAQLAAQDPMLSNLAGIGSGNPANSLKTEEESGEPICAELTMTTY